MVYYDDSTGCMRACNGNKLCESRCANGAGPVVAPATAAPKKRGRPTNKPPMYDALAKAGEGLLNLFFENPNVSEDELKKRGFDIVAGLGLSDGNNFSLDAFATDFIVLAINEYTKDPNMSIEGIMKTSGYALAELWGKTLRDYSQGVAQDEISTFWERQRESYREITGDDDLDIVFNTLEDVNKVGVGIGRKVTERIGKKLKKKNKLIGTLVENTIAGTAITGQVQNTISESAQSGNIGANILDFHNATLNPLWGFDWVTRQVASRV